MGGLNPAKNKSDTIRQRGSGREERDLIEEKATPLTPVLSHEESSQGEGGGGGVVGTFSS